jgi:hypothetical protein
MGLYVRLFFMQVQYVKVLWALMFRFMLTLAKLLGLDTNSIFPSRDVSFKVISEPYRLSKDEIDGINIEVPEEVIKRAATQAGGDKNQYHHLLDVANKYREANLDPVFLTDADYDFFRVTPREFIDNPHLVN